MAQDTALEKSASPTETACTAKATCTATAKAAKT